MRTEGVQIKAAAWRSMPNQKLTGQNAAVMAVFEATAGDWTLSEVMVALRAKGLAWAERSTVNRCLDGLVASERLEKDRTNPRKCRISGMTVTRYFLPKVQKDLFS
jgi:Fe2+ or Zn2+ uptake regulation protein